MVVNLDKAAQVKAEQQQKLLDAMKDGNEEKLKAAMNQFAENIQADVLEKARAEMNTVGDNQVLEARGVHVLTSTERKFYNDVINAGGFDGVEQLVPETVINRVFDELTQAHGLLAAINFVNVGSVTKWIMKNGDVNPAFWGKLTDSIQKKLDNGFKTLTTNLFKLSAYLPVAKAMLDLGPDWLDQYVRAVLVEAMALAMEQAIVSGNGVNQPIGMMKDLDKAHSDSTGYVDKTATALPDLSPKSLGALVVAPLTNNGKRTVANVLIVVNPLDYWGKIFPATTVLNAAGQYVYGVLPIPGTIIQSAAVPVGKLVAGLARNYFLGVGSSQQIVRATEVHIIEDEDVYVTKQYANGQPQDNISFNVFDISSLEGGADTTTSTSSTSSTSSTTSSTTAG